MRVICLLIAVLLPLPLMADPLECMAEGTVKQIAKRLRQGSLLYRDCYYCQQPEYEVIVVEKTEVRPCHLLESEAESALYITGTITRRFRMEKCGEPKNVEKTQAKISGELVVLNYSWLYDAKTHEATNIVDMFGGDSYLLCKRFKDRAQSAKTSSTKKSGS
jgi:hypothetical protein